MTTQPNTNDADRAAFEVWHKSKYDCFDYSILESGEYDDCELQTAWIAWQAALLHARKNAVPDSMRRSVTELIKAAKNMRDAANNLWWAHNPEELGGEGTPPTEEYAQEEHSNAFDMLQRAEYYAQKELDKHAAPLPPTKE
jgi:hypothetical protein